VGVVVFLFFIAVCGSYVAKARASAHCFSASIDAAQSVRELSRTPMTSTMSPSPASPLTKSPAAPLSEKLR